MTIWFIAQVIFDITLVIGLLFCIVKMRRDREEDIRINHGLRLLKSKIAVLEDLSEHTESQSQHIMGLLDKKIREVKKTLRHINQHMLEVDKVVEKSERIAKKMTEEIPHQEIVERNTTSKYIVAAKLAHQGHSVEEITEKLGLPKTEVELICKVNRKKFVFEEKLPQLNTPPVEIEEEDEFKAVKIG